MTTVTLENFAQIRRASVEFGDLTLLIGPQATGKSLFLQWAKLALDGGEVLNDFGRYGLKWETPGSFCDLYFGTGYASALRKETRVTVQGKEKSLSDLLRSRFSASSGKVYYIPAHRSLLLADGWPRPFQQYFPDTPYVARKCSERLRTLLADSTAAKNEQLFPQLKRFKAGLRKQIDGAIFHGASLRQGAEGGRQRLILSPEAQSSIPYMAWTAGQREFGPLLLSMYDLIPPAAIKRRDPIRHVILEEPEMGLHPNGIMVCMGLIVELLYRGYSVTVSTHSPLLATIAWAIERLQSGKAEAKDYQAMLGLPQDFIARAESLKKKSIRAYYFDYVPGETFVETTDISALDPGSESASEAGWGGLTGVSGKIAREVSRVVSRNRGVRSATRSGK